MDLYDAVLANIAARYAAQQEPDTLIQLTPNPGNSGGHCDERRFIKDVLYRVILPTPLRSPESFVLVFSVHDGDCLRILDTREKDILVTEYEESTTSLFIVLHEDVARGSFFTNNL